MWVWVLRYFYNFYYPKIISLQQFNVFLFAMPPRRCQYTSTVIIVILRSCPQPNTQAHRGCTNISTYNYKILKQATMLNQSNNNAIIARIILISCKLIKRVALAFA